MRQARQTVERPVDELQEDVRLVAVWEAMAEHFLDTETRQDIPYTARVAGEAGLSVDEAFAVWSYDVSPAVAMNVLCVAGEWAGWDRASLIRRIREKRVPEHRRKPRAAHRRKPGQWLSIERCMEVLVAAGTDDAGQSQMVRDLRLLANHYFDFVPQDLTELDGPTRRRLWSLFPDPFLHIFRPALLWGEFRPAEARIRKAIDSISDLI
jgi:hypothetical protein